MQKISGFPNFLRKVHQAALSLQTLHENGGDAYISLPSRLRYPERLPEIEKPIISVSVEEEGAPVPTTEELEPVSGSHIMSQVLEHSVNILEVQGEREKYSAQSDLSEEECAGVGSLVKTNREDESPPNIPLIDENTLTPKEDYLKVGSDYMQSGETDVKGESQMAGEIEDTELDTQGDHLPSTTDLTSNHSSMSLQLSRKKVVVDILEAMEVVAPDLDEKTKLSQKVQELATSTLEKLENNSVLFAKLDKLKTKLKAFQENAFQRKLTSLEKMQELENRGHYDHSNLDEKTLKQLENLFNAVNRVLQDDKDMRTGKGYLKTYARQESDTGNEEEASQDFQRRENSEREDTREQPNAHKIPDEVTTSPCSDGSKKQDGTAKIKSPENRPGSLADAGKKEELPQDSRRKENREKKDTGMQPSEHVIPDEVSASSGLNSSQKEDASERPKPPDDPPGPGTSGSPPTVAKGCSEEGVSGESGIEADNKDMRNSMENKNTSSGWSSWLYFPFSTPSMEGKAAQEVSDSGGNSTGEIHCAKVADNIETTHSEANSSTLIAQAWYIVGLGWIFQTESKSGEEVCDPQPYNETQAKSECGDKVDVKYEKGTEGITSWYWYPVNGMYRVYTWVFNASQKENV